MKRAAMLILGLITLCAVSPVARAQTGVGFGWGQCCREQAGSSEGCSRSAKRWDGPFHRRGQEAEVF